MIINNYPEAVSLYSTTESECRERERALQDAHAEMQRAMRKFRRAQCRLTEAEFRVGKVRNIIRQCGFGEVLRIRPRSCMSSSKS